MIDYYKQLGIPSTATSVEIKKAYRKLALMYHPDRNPGDKRSEEIFKLINNANHTLSDSKTRYAYDAEFNKAKANYIRKQIIYYRIIRGALYKFQNKTWYRIEGRWMIREYKNRIYLMRVSSKL